MVFTLTARVLERKQYEFWLSMLVDCKTWSIFRFCDLHTLTVNGLRWQVTVQLPLWASNWENYHRERHFAHRSWIDWCSSCKQADIARWLSMYTKRVPRIKQRMKLSQTSASCMTLWVKMHLFLSMQWSCIVDLE